MIEAEWWEYDSLDELADAVAGDVGFIIESAVDARDASLIAIPGGTTGPAIFPKLAAQKLPWKRVTIIPTDDRLVPMDSELQQRARDRQDVPADRRAGRADRDRDRAITGWPAIPPTRGCRTCRGRPTSSGSAWARTGIPPRSFAGPDLQDALDAPKARRAIGVMPDPLPAEAPVARVTLTRAAILSARTILITITGERKARAARAGDRRRAKLEAADRPRARRSRAADRHPLVPVSAQTSLEAAARGFLEEQQRDDHRNRGEDDRVPQACVDIAGHRDEREAGDRQEPADPAGADMVGKRHGGVADARREHLHQRRRLRPVERGRGDHESSSRMMISSVMFACAGIGALRIAGALRARRRWCRRSSPSAPSTPAPPARRRSAIGTASVR